MVAKKNPGQFLYATTLNGVSFNQSYIIKSAPWAHLDPVTLVLKIYRQVSLFYKSFYCAKIFPSIMSFAKSKLSWKSRNCHNSLFRIIRSQEKLNIRNTSLSLHCNLQVGGAAAALAGALHSNVLQLNSWCRLPPPRCCSSCSKAGLQNTRK